MNALLLVIPVATLLLLPTAFVKLSTVICRARFRWFHCFVFGAVVVAISVGGRVISMYLWAPPLWGAVIIATALYLGFGSWYVGSRATARDGKPVGPKEGCKVMLVYLALLGVVVATGLLLMPLLPRTQ